MSFNITKKFLQELHQQTKDIPKLQHIGIRIPIYNTKQINELRDYFKDVATYEDSQDSSIANQEYKYENIKLTVISHSQYSVDRSDVSFYAKFEGSSTPYRLLENIYRGSNFTVGGLSLPFSPLGFATAKALLDESLIGEVKKYANPSELRTIEGFFENSLSAVSSRASRVRENARVNELAVIDIYQAFYNTTQSLYQSIGNFVRGNHYFNTFTPFDTYYAKYHPKAYTIRQLSNICAFIPEVGRLRPNIFKINTRDYDNNDSQRIMSGIDSSFYFLHTSVFNNNEDMLYGINDKLLDIIVRLPYNLMLNSLDVITQPTNNVEYFSKAIPDINLFYVLRDKYIDLRSAVIPSFKDDFVNELKQLHDNHNTSRKLYIDYITHHYDTTNLYTSLDSADITLLYGNVDNYVLKTAKPELRYAIDDKVMDGRYFDLFEITYLNQIKPLITRNDKCSMCSSRKNTLDASLIPDDVVYNREMITKIFKNPETKVNNFVGFNGHSICEHCKYNYDIQFRLYNGFFDSNDCFIGPDSVDTANDSHIYRIHDYNYRPNDMLFVRQNDELDTELHLGVELEMDDPDYNEDGYYDDEEDEYVDSSSGSAELETERAASMFINTLSKGRETSYAMRDGSLSCGFEIATVPATLKAHLDDTLFNYKEAFNKTIRAGYRSHETRTCGLHVHMDRSFFGTRRSEQLYRAAIMAYILERNWVSVSRFSRRQIHNLEQWAKKKNLESFISHMDSVERAGDKFLVEYDNDKYVMLNTLHRNSFELRIFRGTLNLMTYKATLQFVDNLARLAKTVDVAKAQQITFKDIIDFNPHPELVAYVTERFGENYLGE
jgi:hypothetical protein